MTPSDFKRLFDTTVTELQMLLVVKGGEYAADNDRLANFREGARRTGLTPAQVLLVYLDKHYAAICNNIRDRQAGRARALSEPIEGRVHDMINYLILYKALLVEERSVASAINSEQGPKLVWDATEEDV
jgi:hypothetical protein